MRGGGAGTGETRHGTRAAAAAAAAVVVGDRHILGHGSEAVLRRIAAHCGSEAPVRSGRGGLVRGAGGRRGGQAEEYVPLPKGDVHKKKEVVQVRGPAPPPNRLRDALAVR